MKRILIFSLAYYPRHIGGAEVAVKEITDRIPPEEIEFHMVTMRKHASAYEKIGNVHVYRVGFTWFGTNTKSSRLLSLSKYLFPFFALLKASELHKENKYDAIWSIMANYAGFGALFFKLSHKSVPFILTLQEGDPIEYIKKRVGMFYPLFKRIFTKADKIQTISNYLADFAREMGAQNPPIVIPNGVDISHFSKTIPEEELNVLRAEFNKTTDNIFLITTSRLVTKNAVGDIIESLKYLPKDIRLLVLGTGYQEESLKEKVEKLDLHQRVKFLGFVTHALLPAYLKISDIFVRPSVSEGLGNSFIEAMASGLPVIATPVGGISDFLKNKETGLFCAVHDPKDIARKVEIYLRDRNLRDEIVDNAMHMVLDKYDWSTIVKDMKDKVFNI